MELNQYLFSDYINEKIIKMSRFKQLSNSPSAKQPHPKLMSQVGLIGMFKQPTNI